MNMAVAAALFAALAGPAGAKAIEGVPATLSNGEIQISLDLQQNASSGSGDVIRLTKHPTYTELSYARTTSLNLRKLEYHYKFGDQTHSNSTSDVPSRSGFFWGYYLEAAPKIGMIVDKDKLAAYVGDLKKACDDPSIVSCKEFPGLTDVSRQGEYAGAGSDCMAPVRQLISSLAARVVLNTQLVPANVEFVGEPQCLDTLLVYRDGGETKLVHQIQANARLRALLP